MPRFAAFVGLALACGCGGVENAPTQGPPVGGPAAISSADVSAFRLDNTKRIIYLDTQVAPGQRRRFDIGQGSVTLETLGVADKRLTFHYTPKVEGGYTVYECTVPVSPTPVQFQINSDGTPGKPSFDLTKCKLVRRGSRHFKP